MSGPYVSASEVAAGRDRRVPRLVHQAAIDVVMPPEILSNLETIRSLNPGWDCRLYNAQAVTGFIHHNFGPKTLAAYERISPEYGAARADLFRYLALYKLGGVYLDLKSRPSRPFDEVIRSDDRFLLGQWENQPGGKFEGWGLHKELRRTGGGEYQQWFIVSEPGHPFLRAVIQRVLTNIRRYIPELHGSGRMGVLRTTGPIPYTRAIAPLLKDHAHRFVDSEKELGFNYSIYLDIDYTSKSARHYSRATTPVARVSGPRRVASQLVGGMKSARHEILRRLGVTASASNIEVVANRGTPFGLTAPIIEDDFIPLSNRHVLGSGASSGSAAAGSAPSTGRAT